MPELLEKRLAKYALVAGAGLLAAPAAQAGVIYTPADETFGWHSTEYILDLDGNGSWDFGFLLQGDSLSRPGVWWGKLSVFPGSGVAGHDNKAFALSGSAWISPDMSWARPGYATMGMAVATFKSAGWWSGGYWNNVTDRFLGLRFLIGSDTHYGWARMSVTVDAWAHYTAHLTGYAYESLPDTAIHASAEPGTLGLLAGGVLGLALWRRRKQQGD